MAPKTQWSKLMKHTKEEGRRLIIEFSDETIPGLLQPGYVVPAKTSNQNGAA